MVRITINEDLCKGCALCVRACPKQLIELAKSKINNRGYHPATIAHPEECVACAACAKTCPDVVIRIEKD